MLTAESLDPASQQHRAAARQHRVLACVLCQQRKIRCDRTFPCSNCTKHNARCVPATQTRPRRKRFPERELLNRLRHYEALLRENKVKFEPLHKQDYDEGDVVGGSKEGAGDDSDREDEAAGVVSPGHSLKSEPVTEARSIWQAISQESPSNQGKDTPIANAIETNVKNAWAQLMDGDNLLLGMHRSPVDLATFHPDPVTAFKMWQLYLDHVDPLLKITHTPTLQPRFIAAIGNVGAVKPALEALMFGVYSLAILSLSPERCLEEMGMGREELLTKYQFGCEQALMNAGYLRSADLECLTAMTMHLMSLRPGTNPRSIAAMLGLAIRIAECQGIHRESTLAKCTVFEAEMRRRLWWCLMLYDTRMGEKADHKDPSLAPTWDCRLPTNCNDSDLWPDMKEPPVPRSRSTEALYIVARAEMADHIRNSGWFLDFSNPRLKPLARELPDGGSIDAFEKRIERDYLRHCDTDNAYQFFTVGSLKAHLLRSRLFEHFANQLSNNSQPTEEGRDRGLAIALDYLENDTALIGSPLCRGYLWYLQSYFPFPAYMHMIQDMQRRPLGRLADRAWTVMHRNYLARFEAYFKNFSGDHRKTMTPLFIMFSRTMNGAWEALQKACKDPANLVKPGIIVEIERRQLEALAAGFNPELPFHFATGQSPVLSSSMSPATPSQHSSNAPFVVQGNFDSFMMNTERMPYPSLVSQDGFAYDPSQFDWFLQH